MDADKIKLTPELLALHNGLAAMSDTSLSGVGGAPAADTLLTITYAEVQGAPAFDWNHFLRKQRRTKQEWDDAMYLSSKWVTCACGNQCAALPRDTTGMPIDLRLKQLGVDFCEAIEERDRAIALEILAEIEMRTLTLLAAL